MTLKQGDEIIQDLNNIHLINNYISQPIYSTSTAFKGKWYFEYNHINGSNSQVIGFKCPNFSLAACPKGKDDQLFLYTSSTSSKINGVQNSSGYYDLHLPNVGQSRIGIAIDIDYSIIAFVWKDEVRSFSFADKCLNCKILLRDLSGEGYSDYVSVHLNNFQYIPPFNALPWGIYPLKTVLCKKYRSHLSLCSLFLISS